MNNITSKSQLTKHLSISSGDTNQSEALGSIWRQQRMILMVELLDIALLCREYLHGQIVLEMGSALYPHHNYGNTLLRFTASSDGPSTKKVPTIVFLLEQGADVNARATTNGKPAG